MYTEDIYKRKIFIDVVTDKYPSKVCQSINLDGLIVIIKYGST